ncbi:hypothetical protein B0A48_13053 [Cryoendolithus antarcticus]|uniref:Mid2 domain-containing protein n=1 Tax=Cryoendolithus antarcticus TaxID=1507870 RepID=A0A1V8SN53_9PEZI|nr:hypothetical protein B0A48_13053 [Cryoendolithus antarcticus]
MTRLGQVDICWSTDADPIANVSVEVVNNTYSSLSSANAGATTILFNLASFLSTSAATTQSTASTIIPSTSASVSATSTSSQTSSTGSATSTGTYTSSSSSSPASTDTPAGLSQSAKVGIGAGVGVGAVAILACVGMWLYYRRRLREAERTSGTISSPHYTQVSSQYEMREPAEIGAHKGFYEDYPVERHELDAPQVAQEMPAATKRFA